ncbi:MAG: phosphatidylserine decarboxylase family protein [Planctomycetes bacterium]|nr:phosphatidylserine decarboxylase family protein [Planctomycetota bacterium]
MRFPFTPYGYRELFLFGGVPLALAAWAWPTYGPLAAVPFLLLTAFVVNFFRDPERAVPTDRDALVAPADGKVTAIVDCDEPEYLKAPAHKIGIFLNVFDVHVNRAPDAGVVEFVKYTKGKFLDARDPRCASENESNVIGIRLDDGRRVLVRQVTGLIARRIVCGVQVGDRVARGQRIGMMKFGSYTELVVERAAGWKPTVTLAQRPKGAATIVYTRR